MFIRRKTRAAKAYACQILLSFKKSVNYKKNSRQTAVSVVKQLLSDITRSFAGHCPISGANIHIWSVKYKQDTHLKFKVHGDSYQKVWFILFTPLHQFFMKIITRNVPWQNLSNLLIVVLEKFALTV